MRGFLANGEQPIASRGRRDFNVGVSIPPEEGQPRKPVLGVNCASHARGIFDRQNARRGREFRPGDFSANRTGSDFDLRIIANALDLAQLAVRHEVKLVVLLGEPDRRGNGNSSFAESGERDVLLSVDRAGDGHGHIVINARGGMAGDSFGNNSGRECGRLLRGARAVIQ
jgi:hypothetical protein